MADIQSITQGSSYVGNPILGGNVAIGVTIDPTPMTRFATFAYYKDQHLWQQKQTDDATAAKQIANISAFDITSPLTQYSDTLKSQLEEVQKFVRENPDSLVYSRNPEKFQELNEKLNKFSQYRKTATASDTSYLARKNFIDTEADPLKRSVLQDELNLDVKDLFSGGVDMNKILKSSAQIKPDDYVIPQLAVTTTEELSVLGDLNVITKMKAVDLYKARSDSELLASKGKEPIINENSTWFKSLSPDRQDIERRKAAITLQARQRVTNISNKFNDFLKEYQDAHPDTPFESIVGDPSGSDTLVDNIKSANAINEQIRTYNQFVLAGKVKDPTGKVLRRTFEEIKLSDGLSEAEVILMDALQRSGNAILISVEKESQPTDNAIQRENLSAEWARIGIAQQQLGQSSTEDLLSATAVLNQASSILNKGVPVTVYDYDGKGNKKEFLEIADAKLMQEFGKVDQTGKIFDVPDAVQYDKENGQVFLINYNMDSKGMISTSALGKREYKKRVPLDEREWLGIITKRKNPNKDIGGVNAIIEKALMANDGSLYKLSKRYSNQQTQTTQQTSTDNESYTREELKSNGWNDKQIDKASKEGRIKLK